MTDSYDVIVLGLGAMGSATAYELSRRGLRVLGLDRYPPGHTHGSSHGDSRIIRELYYEGTLYVPLLQRAYTLWQELEQASGASLLRITGGVMLGVADAHVVKGSRQTAKQLGLPCGPAGVVGRRVDHAAGAGSPSADHDRAAGPGVVRSGEHTGWRA